MKKKFTIIAILAFGCVYSQAYKGKGDLKGQVGANIQSGGSGIIVTSDFGLGENISFGFTANYLLSANSIDYVKPKFQDRVDLKARFNANIGSVFQLEKSMDIYPGLDLGTRNFGAHLGFRYFFTNGFGLFAEANTPLARYKQTPINFDYYNNQFVFNIGASFNL